MSYRKMLLDITLCMFFGIPVFSLDLPPIYAKILDELSWTLKLKLLKDFTDTTSTTTKTTTTKSARRVGLQALVMSEPESSINLVQDVRTNKKSIYIKNAIAEKDPSIYLKGDTRITDAKDFTIDSIKLAKFVNSDTENNGPSASRRYNKKANFIQSRNRKSFTRNRFHEANYTFYNSSQMGRRQAGDLPNVPSATEPPDDENNMRMKLFRLMYETVRDSDLKVKRAELIKTHYHNSSAFDIGYLMGDITDKYNIMHDIAMTLERLYHEWKPLEHINAYEQIANQAIQINHLIDMVRHISKRSNSTL